MNPGTAQAGQPAPYMLPLAEPANSQQAPTSDVGRRRARRTDPTTSHKAAADAYRFAASHAGRILAALDKLGSATAHEIAKETGLSVVQCCRRTVEMQRQGRIDVVADSMGIELVRDGYRVWRLA